MAKYSVVGVRFKEAGKVYYFSPNKLELPEGDPVIVETVRGVEYGKVAIPVKEVAESEVVQPLKKVLRRATDEDAATVIENQQKALRAREICEEKIAKHKMEMKLVNVEYTFDNSKIIFYFTADGRVDFRNLVKDLAGVFRTRIELRQIGVRDEAKMLGGFGSCGRSLCCATFLDDFQPVSIKMAKEQNLSLNPAKISGVCGRLMCCLRYESEYYHCARRGLPQPGKTVSTSQGKAKVIEVNILKRKIRAQLQQTGTVVELSPEDLQQE